MKKYITKTKLFIRKNYLAGIALILLILPFITVIVNSKAGNSNENAHAQTLQPTISIPEPVIFRDAKTNAVLSIQLAQGLPMTGQFTFFVPQKGYYSGTIPLNFSGQQIVHPQGQISGKFSPPQGGVPVASSLKMEGEINTKQNMASINIWVDGTKYQLQTATFDTTQATIVAKQTVTYTAAHNWTGVYSLFSPDIQTTTSQAQFTQLMNDTSSGTIVSASLNGTGEVKNVGGYSYFAQPITVMMKKPDGTTSTYHSNEYFVFEQESWRLLTTDTPTQ